MPIYEYECGACGKRCELLQKINDPPVTECPHCKAGKIKRLVSPTGFQLKGSGWYVTDFRNKDKKGKPEAKRSGTAKTESATGETNASQDTKQTKKEAKQTHEEK